MSDCKHPPSVHKMPFWFADQLQPEDPGYNPDGPRWRAFLQEPGMVCPIEPVFFSEDDCLSFIRDVILKATTICDR